MIRDENGTHFDHPSPSYDQKDFVPLEVKSGALVVIHGDLIHQRWSSLYYNCFLVVMDCFSFSVMRFGLLYSFENHSPVSRHALSLHVVDTEGCEWSKDNWSVHDAIPRECFVYFFFIFCLFDKALV
jgi:phytanoyl-CoA hydroxylase